ncbi:MAG: porin family protein [Myxococcota bacterium]|nr:porin family protein [Myxococcota bacterium]
MKRAVLAMALVTVSSGIASAGTYIGLGVGTGPSVSPDELENDLVNDGRSGRLILGHRLGRFAVEGAVGKYDLVLSDNGGGGPLYEVYQAQVSGKFSLPLGDGFEAFGRLGLHKQWFNSERSDFDTSGSGWLIGAGFEYRFKTGIGGFSLFVDYQYSRADVSGDALTFGATSTRMWTLGATIGF